MPRRNRHKPVIRFVPPIGCGTKRRFQNEYEAKKAAELQELRDMNLTLHVYQCSECGKWHLTRQERDSELYGRDL